MNKRGRDRSHRSNHPGLLGCGFLHHGIVPALGWTNPLLLLPIAIFRYTGVSGIVLLQRRATARFGTPHDYEVILWSTIGEGIGIFLFLNVLVNINHQDLILPDMAAVVGLHFIPMAYAIPFRDTQTGGWHDGSMRTIYEATGGIEGLRLLASAWHKRVMADEVVSHAFSHGFHPDHTERLAAYWAEALGGPVMYSAKYGNETTVVKMHSGNGAHEEMDRRAIACFDQALVDVGLANADSLRLVLHHYFAWAATTTMSRFHESADDVPAGLSIPRWSWSGLET